MLSIPGYSVKRKIHESENSVVFRAMRLTDRVPVILKVLKHEYPTPEALRRYRQEYEITRTLNVPGIVKVHELMKHRKFMILVSEDFAGEPLSKIIKTQKLTLMQQLEICLTIVRTLGQIHSNNIIHKDISLDNLIYNIQTQTIKFIDFGIATRFIRENPTQVKPGFFEATLSNISPEQTGRMNRFLDYRSDFYSLGVCFYQLFTGVLPFKIKDPRKLVLAHLRKNPTPPHLINVDLPEAISAIIMKLMAKNAEDRYRGAWGLETDLKYCSDRIQDGSFPENFVPGGLDISAHFQIPQKLYDRKKEVSQLETIFRQTVNGCNGLVLIQGSTGVGKSTLARELYRATTQEPCFFISGNYDQFRQMPYKGLSEAFNSLIQQVLLADPNKINDWKSQINDVLGLNYGIIGEIVPDLFLLLETVNSPSHRHPKDNVNRVYRIFRKFMRIFCREEHPIILLLDDLQWADETSLQLLSNLMADESLKHFLILATINTDVPSNPQLESLVRRPGLSPTTVTQIHLEGIKKKSLMDMVASTFQCGRDKIKQMGNALWEQTKGNPLFLKQMLYTMYRQGWVYFIPPGRGEHGGWKWDLKVCAYASYPKDSEWLIHDQLKHLPKPIKDSLQHAASIGTHFTLDMLSHVAMRDPQEIYIDLFPAIQNGLIMPTTLLEATDALEGEGPLLIRNFKFTHDLFQKVAINLLEPNDQKQIHLAIARNLQKGPHRYRLLFETADHLIEGLAGIEKEEAFNFAQCLERAGQQSMRVIAYKTGYIYFSKAIELLEMHDLIDAHKELSGDLFCAAYQTSQHLGADARQEILARGFGYFEDPVIQAALRKAQVTNLLDEGKQTEAIEVGLEALKQLGITFSDDAAVISDGLERIEKGLAGRAIATLLFDSAMSHPQSQVCLGLLTLLIKPAQAVDQHLFHQMVLHHVETSLSHGQRPESAMGFAYFALVLLDLSGNTEVSHEWGTVAVKISDRCGDLAFKGQTTLLLVTHLLHWRRHIRFAEHETRSGFDASLDSGSFQTAGQMTAMKSLNTFFRGEDLKELSEDLSNYINFAKKTDNEKALRLLFAIQNTIVSLVDPSLDLLEFDVELDNFPDEEKFCLRVLQAQSLFFHNECARAQQILDRLKTKIHAVGGVISLVDHNFYHSLCLLGQLNAGAENVEEISEQIRLNQNKLHHWASHCPENFRHKFLIIHAELNRLQGHVDGAMELYDQAIKVADDNGFIQDKALANELAGYFWMRRRKEKIAQLYMREAHVAYGEWGAGTKVKELQNLFPQLFTRASMHQSTMTQTFTNTQMTGNQGLRDQLNLASVIKASQAISEAIVLSDLLRKMMFILMENAGAQRGILLLPKHRGWVVQAEGFVDSQEIEVLQNLPLNSYLAIPQSMIQYVIKSKENVVIDDLDKAAMFSQDPYLRERGLKSVLCIPIHYQRKLSGILYLENSLVYGAFTSDRIETLHLLASQAAVSIENASLYANMERLIEERTRRLQDALAQLEEQHMQLKNTQSQLVQTEKMAGLGTLVAGVAHEINNPTNFVQSGAQDLEVRLKKLKKFLLRLTGDDASQELLDSMTERFEPISQDLKHIIAGTHRIEVIVHNLRTFSRLDEADQKRTNISDGLVSTMNLVKINYLKIIEFQCEIIDDPVIDCWPAQLNQVFMNLIMNACQSIELKRKQTETRQKGKVQIEMKQEGDMLKITFTDNGCGISKQNLARIYEPFFTTKPMGAGTGLGLSISSGIIKRHQGKISVKSRLNQGTTFTLKLPLLGEEFFVAAETQSASVSPS